MPQFKDGTYDYVAVLTRSWPTSKPTIFWLNVAGRTIDRFPELGDLPTGIDMTQDEDGVSKTTLLISATTVKAVIDPVQIHEDMHEFFSQYDSPKYPVGPASFAQLMNRLTFVMFEDTLSLKTAVQFDPEVHKTVLSYAGAAPFPILVYANLESEYVKRMREPLADRLYALGNRGVEIVNSKTGEKVFIVNLDTLNNVPLINLRYIIGKLNSVNPDLNYNLPHLIELLDSLT